MTLVVNSKALNDARHYAGQIEEEFKYLIEAFHVDAIRATGIELKVNELKHALSIMEVEKIPEIIVKEEETPPVTEKEEKTPVEEEKPPTVKEEKPFVSKKRKRKVY